MPGFVQHQFHTAGQDDGRCDAEAFVLGLASNLDALGGQLLDGGSDVIAHERQLVTDAAIERWSLGRMDAKFCRGQSKDEPSITLIYVPPAEDIPEDGSYRFGFRRIQQRMSSRDRHERILQQHVRLSQIAGSEPFANTSLRHIGDQASAPSARA